MRQVKYMDGYLAGEGLEAGTDAAARACAEASDGMNACVYVIDRRLPSNK